MACALPAAALFAALASTSPPLRFADGIPKGASLSPLVVRLRTAALRKPLPNSALTAEALGPHDEKLMRRTQRRASRLVRVAEDHSLPPEQASDLVDSIPTAWSARKRQVAVELVHAFASEGTVVRRGTFASLVGACRKAGELSQAEALLERLHGVGLGTNPNVYAALMGDLCAAGHPARALALEASMRKMGVRATNETLTVLLSSLGRAGAVEEALRLAQRIRIDAESGGAVYDLPLYNAVLQALLVGGNEADVTRVIELLRAAGHVPSTRTLNVLLKGLIQTRGSLEAALEVFNSFCAAGGEPGVMSYNILLAGFAREGQLLNCEVLLSQLRQQGRHRAADDAEGTAPPEKLCQQEEEQRQEEEEEGAAVDPASRGSAVQGAAAAAGTGRPAGADVAAAMALPEDALAGCAVAQEGLRPDAYTYNALLLAALNSGRPGAAIAHRKLMLEDGVDADAVTLKLLVSAYTASERPLEGVAAARAALERGELEVLDAQAYTSLLAACSAASSTPKQQAAARDALLWLLQRMVDIGDTLTRREQQAEAAAAKRPAARGSRSSGGEASSRGGGDRFDEVGGAEEGVAPVLLSAAPPWHSKAHWMRDVLRTLGNAQDFAGARRTFERAPRPRPQVVWEEMIRVCNLCGEPGFASEVLSESVAGLETL